MREEQAERGEESFLDPQTEHIWTMNSISRALSNHDFSRLKA